MKLCLAIWSLGLLAGVLTTAAAEAELLFVRRVGPLLQEKCLACHGQDENKLKGGLDLRDLESARRGGESGKPALQPGRPEESPVYLAVTRLHKDWEAMPPKEADKLSDEQTGWIRQWIADGAPWPEPARLREITAAHAQKWSAEDGVQVKTSGGLSPEWTNRQYKPETLWAYQPVRKPRVPLAAEKERKPGRPTLHPIDAFLTAKFSEGTKPASRADRRTLIRRATFDLTGLPPAPEEVRAYLEDEAEEAEAFSKVIERLLASPHYGERMAQHWLDVARYADSSGFANDYERGNAWRYRDYVVRAFNDDKPYDRFVREQIAGDEIAPENPEALIATGFLRMGPWELTGMEVPRIARQRFLDDVVNSVGETFLAHSLQCARCHDHKFDPIPTRDFYSIQAVFATTQLAERPAPFLPVENTNGFSERPYVEERGREYKELLRRVNAKKTLDAARQWLRENKRDPAEFEKAVAEEAAAITASLPSLDRVRKRMQEKQAHPDLIPPQHAGFTTEDYGHERIARKGQERLRWELERYEPFALAVYNGGTPQVNSVNAPVRPPEPGSRAASNAELEETRILIGGDPFSGGEQVTPGVLSVLGRIQREPIPESVSGRRKAFAEWVTSAENPLTTRAMVNRIWLWHFGEALAGNPNNFGVTGAKPAHPELLDWLAAVFVEQGWSLKAMHRLIMQSEAYQRSEGSGKAGPSANHAAFKARRLSAEELRDAMLAASGELNREIGGIPNRPEMHPEVALQPRQVMGTFAAAWTANPWPQQRHRRSIYALKLRGLPDPFMEVFNAPSLDFSCERRDSSTVTPQVFSLFNGQNAHSRALALANRVLRETSEDAAAIRRCFELALARRPSESELANCLESWRKLEAMITEAPPTAKPPLEAVREAVEENTGEKFVFRETLHAHRDFRPDLQPADVSRRTRALADICLALFNCHEFAYVY